MAQDRGAGKVRARRTAWCAALAITLLAYSTLTTAQMQPQAGGTLPASTPLSSAQPVSAVPAPPASSPAASGPPRLNQAKLILQDGRWLVPGGATAWKAPSDHPVDGDSELYDPNTRQWQALPELHFSGEQSVHVNQLRDGRVLFFIVQKGDTPSYSARSWRPATNRIENIKVGAKPAPDSGVAVLNDGRVLIVDSEGGNAVIWDSRTNAVTARETPEIENSRWRTLPLQNGGVLLLEELDEQDLIRPHNENASVALLWQPVGDDWKRLADFPARFSPDGILMEQEDGAVHAEMPGHPFRLSANGWEGAPPLLEAPPPSPQAAPAPTGIPVTASAPIPAAQADDSSEAWSTFFDAAQHDLSFLTVLLPAMLGWLVFTRLMEDRLSYDMRSSFGKFNRALLGLILLALIWILLRNALIALPGVKLWWEVHYAELAIFLFAFCALFLVMAPLLRAVAQAKLDEHARTSWIRRINMAAHLAGMMLVLLFLARLEQTWYAAFWEPAPYALVSDGKLILASLAVVFLVILLHERREKKRIGAVRLVIALWQAVIVVIIAVFLFSAMLSNAKGGGVREYAQACSRQGWQPLDAAKLQKWAQCVDVEGGLLQGALFHPTAEVVQALPSAPCGYVGVWSSTRPGSRFKVTLTGDGRFNGVPMTGAPQAGAGGGVWGVAGDKMAWFYDAGVAWPSDINQILPGPDADHFTLVEVNGMRTRFERMDKRQPTGCQPQP